MRLFVGVEIDDHARQVAEATVHALRLRMASEVEARWVAPENMHLTARFIGHVDDRVVADMLTALTRPVDLAPFDVELGACGLFPAAGPPRVIWIGVAAGERELSVVHDEFDRRLAPFGFEPEGRPFTAHLTLARIKHARRGASASVRAAFAHIDAVPATFRVRHATIFESRPTARGHRYEPLGRAQLLP